MEKNNIVYISVGRFFFIFFLFCRCCCCCRCWQIGITYTAMVLDSIYDIDNERQIEEAKEEDETHITMHTYRTIPKEHVLPLSIALAGSRSLNIFRILWENATHWIWCDASNFNILYKYKYKHTHENMRRERKRDTKYYLYTKTMHNLYTPTVFR